MSSGGPPPARLPIVGVMGSGSAPHEERAAEVGSWLATEGVHLLTGGGGGVMESVSRAFSENLGRRGGVILGVLPGSPEAPAGYPNPWVEIAIRTHLPVSGERGTEALSRNHINVLSSDVIIALPGSAGTSSEVRLACAYGRPVVAFLGARSEIPNLPAEVPVCATLDCVKRFVSAHLARPGP